MNFEEAIYIDLPQEAEALMESIRSGTPRRSLRLNPRKPSGAFATAERVKWLDSGRYAPEGTVFTHDPLFHAGAYYVQDASSMFVGHAVKSIVGTEPVVLLDACAAPGGKTTAAIDALPAGSMVVANEIVPARCAVLKENIIKWGYPSVIVTRADTAALARLGQVADIIIADVPCSGEGMMRKDPEAVAQWSQGLVSECHDRQIEIVHNLWQSLRPGGYMIYSTCTYNRTENERVVSHIISEFGAEAVEIPTDPAWGILPATDGITGYRFMPHRLDGEGLFVAVVRKPGDTGHHLAPAERRRKADSRPVPGMASQWLTGADAMQFITADDRITAIPKAMAPLLRQVEDVAAVVHSGVRVATVKGRDIIPDHALAMSTLLAPDAFARVELSAADSLAYLRRESLRLPDDTPRGYVIVTHAGLPLGFMKNLGNRANNLYPQPFKIRI